MEPEEVSEEKIEDLLALGVVEYKSLYPINDKEKLTFKYGDLMVKAHIPSDTYTWYRFYKFIN